MVLAGFALVGALAILALRANPLHIQRLRLRGEVLMLALFVVQAVARGRLLYAVVPRLKWDPVLPWTLATVALLALAVANFMQRGMPVVAAGLVANLVAVVANGGMPISGAVLNAPGRLSPSSLTDPFYVLVGSDTRLAVLGDVIGAPSLALRSVALVLSVGDVCMLAGVSILLLSASMAPEYGERGCARDAAPR